MIRFALLMLSGLSVLATGCGTNPGCQRQVNLLRAEIIDLENRYYALEAEHRDVCDQCGVEAAYPSNGIFDSEFEEPEIIPVPSGRITPGTEESNPDSRDDESGIEEPMIDDGTLNFNPPDLDPDDLQLRSNSRTSPRMNSPAAAGNRDSGSDHSSSVIRRLDRPEMVKAVVTDIAIHGGSAGRDFDGKPGHDGINLIIQPIGDDGAVIPAAGEITVSAIDPKQTGTYQRIGLWRYKSSEVQPFIETGSRLEPGIHLQLKWNATIPANPEIKVFVRYRTVDGRDLESSRTIKVELMESNSDRWTRLDSDRSSDTADNPADDPVSKWADELDDIIQDETDSDPPPSRPARRRNGWQPNR